LHTVAGLEGAVVVAPGLFLSADCVDGGVEEALRAVQGRPGVYAPLTFPKLNMFRMAVLCGGGDYATAKNDDFRPGQGVARPEQIRLFCGYAGWSADQLEGELAQHAWFAASGEGPRPGVALLRALGGGRGAGPAAADGSLHTRSPAFDCQVAARRACSRPRAVSLFLIVMLIRP
jgi:hypothetical protein